MDFVDSKRLRFVARQPIFDREEQVFGYESLARSSSRRETPGSSCWYCRNDASLPLNT